MSLKYFEQIPLCKNSLSSKHVGKVPNISLNTTRNQINDTFLFQNRVKVVGEVSEK